MCERWHSFSFRGWRVEDTRQPVSYYSCHRMYFRCNIYKYVYICIYIYIYVRNESAKINIFLGFSLYKTGCTECKKRSLLDYTGYLQELFLTFNSILSYIHTYSLYFSLYVSTKYDLLNGLVLYPGVLTTFSHTRQTKTELTVSH